MPHPPGTLVRSAVFRVLGRLAGAPVLLAALAGCASPPAGLSSNGLPDSALTSLLTRMRGVSEPARERLAQLERQRDWNGVAQFAHSNLAVGPHQAEWWVVAGYAYAQLGQYQRAADGFQQAVRLEPDEIDSWNLLGQAYRSLGQPERAIRTLDNALRVSQDSPMTWYLIGESFSDLKRPERAVRYYEQAVLRGPTFVEAVYALGLTYARLGRKPDLDATMRQLQQLSAEAAKKLAAAIERR